MEVGNNEKARISFVLDAINEHKGSKAYRIALDADAYWRGANPTIMK